MERLKKIFFSENMWIVSKWITVEKKIASVPHLLVSMTTRDVLRQDKVKTSNAFCLTSN
jgi:hypothetical protein